MRVVLVLIMVLIAAACVEGSESGPPQTAPYIRGVVTSVTPDLILVEEAPDANKASLRIPEGMPVWRVAANGDAEPAQVSDLTERQTVDAWVSGRVAESFPVQATAAAVLIHTD